MFVPELRPWRAARPHVVRVTDAVRPRLARAAGIVRPRLARVAASAGPQVARLAQVARPQLARLTGTGPNARSWQYGAGAATVGLALAAGVVTVAGPWDATGQRTAERDRATALARTGGGDHGRTADSSRTSTAVAGAPRPAPSAASVLVALGGGVTVVKSAPNAVPTGAGVAGVLNPLLADPVLGTRHAAAVVDVATGKHLYGAGAGTGLTPASTTKIATAVAALSAMGGEHRLTTRTVLEPDTKELVLVGGGDPTLTARDDDRAGWAGLRALAASSAAALKKRGLTHVTLSYDTTLYAGSEVHPIGPNGNLARVTALSADEGRPDGSTSGPVTRVPDPAADATRAFAAFLKADGITTTPPGPSKATTRAKSLASVSSPPLSVLVERMLTNSDNDIAEALARHTALATGVRADFAGGGAAVRAQLKKLGLPTAGVLIKDGSGLDRQDRITANLLTALLVKAGDPARPDLRPVLTGLPVAGFTGTLADRYRDGAAGVVRAKTGTLTGVNALAGTVVDQDGRLLAFAFLAAGTTDAGAAQAALDRAATALADCGCR
ncbi:D-alanyl-D-alanine carboxypeptidase/D-alanyl-D-alanine endopeptidase [Streptomyces sp. NPDC054884]|uniref:D-alanyl-D-alanine carboxypeptidase/D-alanyl-D-alanine endopeptidase n=1 Tax=Streptomyces sp. ME08-AFT2 TaxID=3028683 RepID=UPI0029BD69F9|nr:D-alanyl-D-alanine carboxypeptidase/D-alanyl-D-alanine-endopeptidase [Streptomyces sp. ME08-AFT2]MDX3311986.1 D-alanyl-D-alanine carboxypeptidase/D-alanyl-D-alanine-endopeptidase [Streptomyces sp. ME08-AFT2]